MDHKRMVANNISFSRFVFVQMFALIVFCICATSVFADTYSEGPYGSERYSGNNSTTTVSSVPLSVIATPGNEQANISFSPPSSTGGAAIISYTVTSSPDNIVATGNSSPIIVIGLTNGVSYTFTMTATNSVGVSASSSVSNAVIPSIPPSNSNSSSGGSSGSTKKSYYTPKPSTFVPIDVSTINIPSSVTPSISPTPATNTSNFGFTKDLSIGGTDSEVRELQKFLNLKGFIVSTEGAGSPGNESDTFGPKTRDALIKFQLANRISPAVGYFGPVTRTLIESLLGTSNTSTDTPGTPSTLVPTESTSDSTTDNMRDLELGAQGNDVKALQKTLNERGFLISITPGQPGSIGFETDYFGPKTRDALIKFQLANRISPAVGYFGQKTRAVLK